MRTITVLLTALFLCAPAPAQRAPITANPLVDVHGTIQRVQISPGQGMPYLMVDDGKKLVKVYLGSMRYLIERNFNPKVGCEVSIRGYRLEDAVIASTVKVIGDTQALRLRDENGWPLWRGGMRRGGPPR